MILIDFLDPIKLFSKFYILLAKHWNAKTTAYSNTKKKETKIKSYKYPLLCPIGNRSHFKSQNIFIMEFN